MLSVLKAGEPTVVMTWPADAGHVYNLIGEKIRENEVLQAWDENGVRGQVLFSRKVGALFYLAANTKTVLAAIDFVQEYMKDNPKATNANTIAVFRSEFYEKQASLSPLLMMLTYKTVRDRLSLDIASTPVRVLLEKKPSMNFGKDALLRAAYLANQFPSFVGKPEPVPVFSFGEEKLVRKFMKDAKKIKSVAFKRVKGTNQVSIGL